MGHELTKRVRSCLQCDRPAAAGALCRGCFRLVRRTDADALGIGMFKGTVLGVVATCALYSLGLSGTIWVGISSLLVVTTMIGFMLIESRRHRRARMALTRAELPPARAQG